jgi:hypothetical protein
MATYSEVVTCSGCQSLLTITMKRDDEARTKTAFTVSCPVCHKDVDAEIPLSIMLSSLQVAWFERATNENEVEAWRSPRPK